ncbi:hypothetical protein J2S42_001226 [Catenuloplanes indicus]|uniref:Uncharacterized protein n=1 Tax=Catenuloplanes indicus TaxID=137267 RepID=A0AAE3VVV7_9ACTN|nr:hypothetical protein [Catenuloplanes indicus]
MPYDAVSVSARSTTVQSYAAQSAAPVITSDSPK